MSWIRKAADLDRALGSVGKEEAPHRSLRRKTARERAGGVDRRIEQAGRALHDASQFLGGVELQPRDDAEAVAALRRAELRLVVAGAVPV